MNDSVYGRLTLDFRFVDQNLFHQKEIINVLVISLYLLISHNDTTFFYRNFKTFPLLINFQNQLQFNNAYRPSYQHTKCMSVSFTIVVKNFKLLLLLTIVVTNLKLVLLLSLAVSGGCWDIYVGVHLIRENLTKGVIFRSRFIS